MKNTLHHIVDRLPSGLSAAPRDEKASEREASVLFLDSGKNLTMLHEAIKAGVCLPHLLPLQTASTLYSRSGKLLLVWVVRKQTNALARVLRPSAFD